MPHIHEEDAASLTGSWELRRDQPCTRDRYQHTPLDRGLSTPRVTDESPALGVPLHTTKELRSAKAVCSHSWPTGQHSQTARARATISVVREEHISCAYALRPARDTPRRYVPPRIGPLSRNLTPKWNRSDTGWHNVLTTEQAEQVSFSPAS